MNNVLWTFQNRITHLQPAMLWALAGVTIAAGVFLWLGGFGFKKTMYAVAGIYVGAFCTLFISVSNLPLAGALIGIFAMTALAIQETFFVLTASACAAVIGFSFLIGSHFRPSSNLLMSIRMLTISVPYYNWPILLAVTALPFAVISWRGASALFSSAAGAVLALAGVIMVVLNSTDFPIIGHMKSQPEQYYLMLALVVIFGIAIQMMVLPKISKGFAARQAKVKAKKGKIQKDGSNSTVKSVTWRTS
jgi:hypothetical protein